MNSTKEVTIYDIAKKLNVSPTTVSRALKDHFSIGKETTLAVKALAEKLNYQPNKIASNLRKSKTHTIGVIVSWINRPFISSAISGIEEVAYEAGYNVIIAQSNDSYLKEVANTGTLYSNRVDGLIISLAMETDKFDHFVPFQKKGIPLVFFDRASVSLEVDKVVIDNFAAAYKATEHLIAIGCRKIAHFAGSPKRNIYKRREEGYIKALQDNGLPINESLIIHTGLSQEDGWKSTELLLNQPNLPDAIFSANDTAAVSAIQFIKQRGLCIPEDIAVVGFNNDPISSIIEPSLTTISQPAFEMGKIAAKQLLKSKENKDIITSETVVLKTELLIRNSSLRKVIGDNLIKNLS
jgi:LacI family transcriptional regulator